MTDRGDYSTVAECNEATDCLPEADDKKNDDKWK